MNSDHMIINLFRNRDVEDIDLWSGAVSEISVEGGRVGPTFACLIGRQSQATKFGDRFWYENGGRFLFSPGKSITFTHTRACARTHTHTHAHTDTQRKGVSN